MKRLALAIVLALAAAPSLAADDVTDPPGPASPPASVEQFSWMAGRWVGEGLGGKVEELFSPPAGGQMIGHFRSWNDKGPSFYELECICTVGDSLVYRVKHFNPDFHGWEEKDQYRDFRLVSIDGDTIRFDGLTIQRIGTSGMRHVVTIKEKDGKTRDLIFTYRRAE